MPPAAPRQADSRFRRARAVAAASRTGPKAWGRLSCAGRCFAGHCFAGRGGQPYRVLQWSLPPSKRQSGSDSWPGLASVLGQSMFRPPGMRAVMRCNNKPGVYQCEKERIVPEALICVRASTNRRAERCGGAGVNARETAHHLCIFNHGCDLLIENMIDQLAIRALSL